MSILLGAAGCMAAQIPDITVLITDASLSSSGSGNAGRASLFLDGDGDLRIEEYDSGGTPQERSPANEWGTPITTGIGNYYEARLTKSSGSDPNLAGSSALGEWVLMTDIEWGWSQGTVGSKSFEGTLEIRRLGEASAADSCTVSVSLSTTAG